MICLKDTDDPNASMAKTLYDAVYFNPINLIKEKLEFSRELECMSWLDLFLSTTMESMEEFLFLGDGRPQERMQLSWV
ncbi:MAG: hypothetical protein EAX81_02530 [Candidatus Thorarchaeota archaeon]|nr:hypothetical protein [Candidatus Thorarchaeota archaeon]